MRTGLTVRRAGVVGAATVALVLLGAGSFAGAAFADGLPGPLSTVVSPTGPVAAVTAPVGTAVSSAGATTKASTPPNPVTTTVGTVVKTVTDAVDGVLPGPVADTVHKVLGSVPLPGVDTAPKPEPKAAAPTHTRGPTASVPPPARVPALTVPATTPSIATAPGKHVVRTSVTALPDLRRANSADVLTSGLASTPLITGLPYTKTQSSVTVEAPVTATATRTAVQAPVPGGTNSLPGIVIVLATVAVGTVGAAHVGLFQQYAGRRARPTT